MNDRNSQVYMDTVKMITNAIDQILINTHVEVDSDDIAWEFTADKYDSSTLIAEAEKVAMANTNMASIEAFLQDVDYSNYPGLLSVIVEQAGAFNFD